MAKSVGVIRVWWQGTQYDCIKGSSIRLSGARNVTQVAGYSAHRSQEFQAGEVKVTTLLLRGQSLAALMPGPEGELQVVADSGQTWTIPDAFILDAPTMTDDGGKCPITWNFSTYQELIG
ncbi:phage tail tube protein [Gluconacetobacter azotocaptans]|uniref:phage tail tube protein n=1 Tax=Gluconacetobacter azotocaptans TaxID=142834 RepID=UPI00195EA7E2|nr:phage tail tube protein [Gluconacetobacter azotocaptans]MBM9400381.1 phage tail tube protein [Gluconacetobacter azotocaptans]